jgi:Ca2+-binding EF-hand superfamily protein
LNAEPHTLLDCNELLEALMSVESHSNAKTEGVIPFSAFPEDVQDKLKELDTSGDGKIDAKEIIAGMQALQR